MAEKYKLVEALRKNSEGGEKVTDVLAKEGLSGLFKRKKEQEEEERKRKEAEAKKGY